MPGRRSRMSEKRGRSDPHRRSRGESSSSIPVVDLTDDTDDAAGPSAAVDLTDDATDTSGPSAAGPSASASDAAQHTLSDWLRPDAAITCPICFCDAEVHEAARLSACGHDFCTDCVQAMVRGKVEAGEVLPGQVRVSRCGGHP